MPVAEKKAEASKSFTPYEPKAGEEYMNEQQLEHFRQLLLDWKQDHEEAEKVIAAIRGFEIDSDDTRAERDRVVDSIRASGFAASKSTPVKALFTGGKTQHFRRMLLGAGSQFMQQVGGCNAVIYYFPILCTDIFGDKNFALLLGGVNMIVYSIFATSSWFLIERVGRRKLLLIGTAGQMLSMFLTMGFLIPGGSDPGNNAPQISKGAIAGLFTYIASFGATWLPLPWLYPAEVNPLKTRGKANATSTCTNWLFNFVIVMIVPIMISNIHWGTYLFFGCANATFFPILYWFYPEVSSPTKIPIDHILTNARLPTDLSRKSTSSSPRATLKRCHTSRLPKSFLSLHRRKLSARLFDWVLLMRLVVVV